jgi:BirA family biotin operon repressor/biotin-[acetyl-CoA-carboxylase] ligase
MNFEIRRFDSIDSTNRYLLDEARRGAPEGLVAVADHQTAGRGRRGRSWSAPPGSALLVSVLLRPFLPAARVHLVTMAAGLAVCEAVESIAGFAPALKWPNDVVVDDRKLAGLLAESEFGPDGAATAVVVGAGVNVDWPTPPPELADIATACNLVAGRPVDRDALLDAFLACLRTRLAMLDGIVVDYRARLSTLGRRVRVETATGTIVATAVDVGDAGELVIEDGDGTRSSVHAGDVVHLRAAD